MIVILAAMVAPAAAQELKLPEEVKSDVGMVLVRAETDCLSVEWWSIDSGLQVVPGAMLKDSKIGICFALKPGTYRLQAIAAKGNKPVYALCTVVVGGGAAPQPPDKPPDKPPPPDPVKTATEFEKEVAAAAKKDGHKDNVAALAALLRMVASKVRESKVSTVTHLRTTIAKATNELLGEVDFTNPKTLPSTRLVVVQELDAKLRSVDPAVSFGLNAKLRAEVGDLLDRVAGALEKKHPFTF